MCKVLFLLSNFNEKELTGQQKIGFGIAERLKRKGFSIQIITNDIKERGLKIIKWKNIKCLIIPREAKELNFLKYTFNIYNFCKRSKMKLIHGCGLASTPLSLFLSKTLKIPFVQTLYDIIGFDKIKRKLFFNCLKFASYIFVSSEYIKNSLREMALKSKNIKTVYQGLDDKWLSLNFREYKDDFCLTILFWGDAKYERGIDVLINLIRRKHHQLSRTRNIKYVFAIRYFEERYKKILSQLTVNFPVEVRYDRENIFKIVNSSHIIVLPYITTTLQPPLTLIESMSTGKIVITSNIQANVEFVKDRQTGFLLKDNTEEELYEILKEVLSSYKKFEFIGMNARRYILSMFDSENNIVKIEEIYRRLNS